MEEMETRVTREMLVPTVCLDGTPRWQDRAVPRANRDHADETELMDRRAGKVRRERQVWLAHLDRMVKLVHLVWMVLMGKMEDRDLVEGEEIWVNQDQPVSLA